MQRKTRHEVEINHLQALLRLEKEHSSHLLELLSEELPLEALEKTIEEEPVTIPSAAKMLDVKAKILYAAGQAGKLKIFRQGTKVLTTQSAIDAWDAARRA